MQNLTTGKTINTKIQHNATQTVAVWWLCRQQHKPRNYLLVSWGHTHTPFHINAQLDFDMMQAQLQELLQSCFHPLQQAGGPANGCALLSRTHWGLLLSEWRAALSQRSELGGQTSAAWGGGSPQQRLAARSQFGPVWLLFFAHKTIGASFQRDVGASYEYDLYVQLLLSFWCNDKFYFLHSSKNKKQFYAVNL